MDRLSRLRFMDTDRTRLPVRRRIRPRGVPNALQDHLVAATEDLQTATGITSQFLGATHLTPARGAQTAFHCALHALSVLDVTVGYLDFGAPTELTLHHAADAYVVHVTSSGAATVHIDGADHDLTPFIALVVSPGAAYRMALARDSPLLIVRVERQAVERQLARMLGRPLGGPIVFEPIADLTTDVATRWHTALQLLLSEVLAPASLLHRGIGGAALEELIVSTLLYIQRHTYSDALEAPRRSGRVAVRRSIDYIEEHLAEPICLADLADHCGMSPRSIQAGFREDLATTPVAYIRDRRLERVRRTLISAIPGDGVTVTEAAQRWGFGHLGDFSVRYKRRYGESPSQTLRHG